MNLSVNISYVANNTILFSRKSQKLRTGIISDITIYLTIEGLKTIPEKVKLNSITVVKEIEVIIDFDLENIDIPVICMLKEDLEEQVNKKI